MQPVDCLINARWIIPIEPRGKALENHSLAVENGRIAGLCPTGEATGRYDAKQTVELSDHVLLPGFVNAHTHAAMSLMRGLADDLPLMTWLKDHIWPAEADHVSPEYVAAGTELAIAEMLAGGTTCFQDMYYFPDVAARTAAGLGMRACVGMIVLDFPTVWAENADEYIHKGIAVHDEYKPHPLITTAFAPHAPYTVSDAPLRKLQTYADEMGVHIHMHVHETAQEVRDAKENSGVRPLMRLEGLGLLNPSLAAVHMTQLEDDEIERVAEHGVQVIHCPQSNLKLASGFCPVGRLLEAGVNVALGTDGAASNNDLDMLDELRTAALLAKAVTGDPGTLAAHAALRMATLAGAQALGLGQEIGSLEPGKQADLCAIDLSAPNTQPVFDPVAQIVYAAGREQVTDTWVAGERLYAEGALTGIDVQTLLNQTRDWGTRLAADATV